MIAIMLRQKAILSVFLFLLGVNCIILLLRLDLLVLPALLLGWYLADLVSGLVHMYMDYRPCPPGKRLNDLFFFEGSRASEEYQALFRKRMASINAFERVVYDFKNHHPRPNALGRRNLWRLIGSTVIVAALPVSLLLNVAALMWPVPGWTIAFCVAFLVGGAFAQYFHGSLHRESNPWIVRWMRRLRLLMTPEAHQLHHDTLQRDFSTNCGWSNPLVNRLFHALRQRGYLDDAGLVPSS